MTVWFLDPSFHTEDTWGTHLHLLQKIQTLTDAPEENQCIKSRGVKTFEQKEDVYIFLVLPKYNIFHLVLHFRSYKRYLHAFQKTN